MVYGSVREHTRGSLRGQYFLAAGSRRMVNQYRDDSPTAFKLTRRKVLAGALGAGGGALFPMSPTDASTSTWSEESAARFVEMSVLLVPHRLNEAIGRRMGAAMGAMNPL